MAFHWRADDGPTLNAGLKALWFYRGSAPIIAKNPYIFVIFEEGGADFLSPPLDPHMGQEKLLERKEYLSKDLIGQPPFPYLKVNTLYANLCIS